MAIVPLLLCLVHFPLAGQSQESLDSDLNNGGRFDITDNEGLSPCM